jgi:hypothetical protein
MQAAARKRRRLRTAPAAGSLTCGPGPARQRGGRTAEESLGGGGAGDTGGALLAAVRGAGGWHGLCPSSSTPSEQARRVRDR